MSKDTMFIETVLKTVDAFDENSPASVKEISSLLEVEPRYVAPHVTHLYNRGTLNRIRVKDASRPKEGVWKYWVNKGPQIPRKIRPPLTRLQAPVDMPQGITLNVLRFRMTLSEAQEVHRELSAIFSPRRGL